jgi:hypothetical protein
LKDLQLNDKPEKQQQNLTGSNFRSCQPASCAATCGSKAIDTK